MFKLERVFLLCLNNHFIILLNINTFYAFFLQKIKTYYLCLILTSFLDCVIREILGSVLKPPFLCKCCNAIRREEVCKQVGCERERLTLYINNTNFPLINMQQLKHIIFQDLLNEPRIRLKSSNLFNKHINHYTSQQENNTLYVGYKTPICMTNFQILHWQSIF